MEQQSQLHLVPPRTTKAGLHHLECSLKDCVLLCPAGGELAKWLKCEWEVEQPALSSHWISFNGPAVPGACGTSLGGSAASDMAQELQAAAGAVRRRLRGGMCGGGGGLVVRAPQVHQVGP